MKYAIVSTEKAVAAGISKAGHRMSADGTQMFLNEKELRRVGVTPADGATRLGGRTIKLSTALQRRKKWDYTKYIQGK